MFLFESERLCVRHLTMDDLDNFYKLNSDPDVVRYIRPVKTFAETEMYLKEVIQNYTKWPYNMRLALLQKDTEQFVGSFAIIPVYETENIQLGYSLLKEYWGRGYATEILKAGLNYAFNDLALPEVFAITETGNTASQKVLLKNGFVFVKAFVPKDDKVLNMYRRKVVSY
jgi:[ribosomal protein S5]-alanine N-acetyltransferase